MAIRFPGVIKQQFGNAFVAAVGNSAVGGRPEEKTLLDFDDLRLGLAFGEAHPGDFGVGIGDAWNDSCIECCSGQLSIA